MPAVSAARSRRRTLRRSAIALTAATTLVGATAGTACAASYGEVVTRATGAAGAAPAVAYGVPGAVSSDGRWSAFSSNPNVKEPEWDGYTVQPPDYYLYVRDIVANRTYQVTTNRLSFASSFDDAGRYLTYVALDSISDINSSLWLVDTKNKTTKLIGRASGANGAVAKYASGRVSGDGTSVVFTSFDVPGSGPGIYRRTLATNVTTRLGDLPAGPVPTPDGPPVNPQGVRSISTDGSVATFDESIGDGSVRSLVITPTQRFEVDGNNAVVSADGSTIAYLSGGSPEQLVFRSVTTGAETSYPAPAGAGQNDGGVVWVSADGKQAAVAPNQPFGVIFGTPVLPYRGQLFDRASASYSPAGPFANALYSTDAQGVALFNTNAISRNGRYTLFTGNGLIVGDNYGGLLPGGVDHAPANAYYTGLSQYCKGETSTNVNARLTPDYLEPAKSLSGSVYIDGTYAGQDTFTSDRTATIPLPADAKTVTIKAKVTFASGQTTSGTYEYGVHNSPYC